MQMCLNNVININMKLEQQALMSLMSLILAIKEPKSVLTL